MRTRANQPAKKPWRSLLVWGIWLLAIRAGGGEAYGQEPYETASGRACFERWIAEATTRLNAHPGDTEFNSRKPWRFNEYGLLAGRGAFSNYAPADWGKCGGNRYCYMWWLIEYTSGFGSRWAVWQAAAIPPLQNFVLACDAGNVPPGPPPIPPPGPPPPPPPNTGYTTRGGYACYGGAEYPASWGSEASCVDYGCKFGNRSLDSCLALGARKGAREVIHGNPGGGRSNECWLQHSCADLRPTGDFTLFRP